SSMAVRVGEPQGSPVPMSRYANLTRDRHPRLASGRGFQTADIGAPAMRNTASGARALAPTTPTIHTSYTPGPYAIGDTGYITSTDRDHHYVAQVCHDR